MYRKIVIYIWFLMFGNAAFSQQMPLYSQYLMNGYLLNPAIAGHDGYTSFNLTAREQWLGWSDSPQTRSFSAQTRLLKKNYVIKGRDVSTRRLKPSTKGRVGLGGYILHDRNGAIERTGLYGSYAYHIFMKDIQFSFGLAGGLFQFKVHGDELTFHNADPMEAEGLSKVIYVPDANFGFYVSHYKFFGGISVNQLFQSYIKLGNQALEEYKMLRHYYLMGGYRFYFNRDYELEPSLLIKATEKLTFQTDIGAKFYYKQDYWAGAFIRTNGALIILAGVRFNQLYFGYAFDYNLSSIRKYNFGSHELVVALKLGDSARRYRWLQRY